MRLYGKILWILIYTTTFSYAQKLDNLGKKGGISLSGGLAINQVLYKEFDQIQTRNPYNLFIAANASLSLYGWSIPFSASYSNRKIEASQPFNRFSLHPTYKNLTIHLGFTSHTLSTYTMAGFPVNGLGIEHSGLGKFTVKSFYGTMNSTVRNDSTGYLSYKRKGMGYALGYRSEKALLDLSMLYSKDSTFNKNAESITLFPEQNLALGLGGIFTLAKFQLAIETGISTIDKQTSGKDGYATSAQSSRTDKALKMGLSYSQSRLALRLNYERIDPEYRTHGIYFMNNDLENLSLTGTLELSEGKGAISITVGNQKNDLDGNKQSATNRFTGSGNIQYRPSEKLSFSGMYSNFKVVTNQRPENTLTFIPDEDSLTFIQLSTQALFQSTYTLSESHSFSVNSTFN
ncbi:MAG: hypothetical protein OEY34_02330, partial [Cyclobacteriaceae bacterium]|nr:hypothetical protein [Cyclobacteriaceae bacterium]